MKVLCVLWMFLALPLVSLGEEKLVLDGMKLKMNDHLNAWNVKLHVDQGGVVYMVAGHLFVWGSQQEAMKLADEDQMPLVMAKVLQEAKHGRSYEKVVRE